LIGNNTRKSFADALHQDGGMRFVNRKGHI
jgi:hypothetical protein